MISIRLTKAEKLRRLLASIFYAAYTVAMFYCLINSTSSDDRLLYSGLLVFVPLGVLYEFIRFFYSMAVDALNEQCDTELAKKYLKFIRRFNLFKSYRAQIAYLGGFILLDDDKPEDAREYIISKLGSMNTVNRIMDFQYNYLLFSCCAALKDKHKIGEYFIALKKTIDMKERPGNDLISLGNLICGVYGLVSRNDREAADSFQKVKPENLSTRERARYYFYSAQLDVRYSDKNKMEDNYDKAIVLAPEMKLIIDHKPKI